MLCSRGSAAPPFTRVVLVFQARLSPLMPQAPSGQRMLNDGQAGQPWGLGEWGGGSGQVTISSTRPPPKDRLQKPSGDHLLFKRDKLLILSKLLSTPGESLQVCLPFHPTPHPTPAPPRSKSPQAAKTENQNELGVGGCSLNSPEPELPRCSPSEGLVANPAPSLGRPGSGGCFGTKLEKPWATTKKES